MLGIKSIMDTRTDRTAPMEETILRFAKPDDAQATVDIFNYYIENSIVTFNTRPRTVEEFRDHIAKVTEQYPWLIAERNGEIIGYAYANTERRIDAYAWNVELTIMLKDGCTHAGLGTRLMQALLGILEHAGYKNAYSVLSVPNEASTALHEKFGFEHFSTHTHTGYKQGRWLDTDWFVKRLGRFDDEAPAPLKMPRDWDAQEIEKLLGRQ